MAKWHASIKEVRVRRLVVEADTEEEAMSLADEAISVSKALGRPGVLGRLISDEIELIDTWRIREPIDAYPLAGSD